MHFNFLTLNTFSLSNFSLCFDTYTYIKPSASKRQNVIIKKKMASTVIAQNENPCKIKDEAEVDTNGNAQC